MNKKYEMFKETLNLNTRGVKMEQNGYQNETEISRIIPELNAMLREEKEVLDGLSVDVSEHEKFLSLEFTFRNYLEKMFTNFYVSIIPRKESCGIISTSEYAVKVAKYSRKEGKHCISPTFRGDACFCFLSSANWLDNFDKKEKSFNSL